LFFAVRAGDLAVVDSLLTAGADVNQRTPVDEPKLSPAGDTMLVTAIANGHFGLADFLLNKGADPNAAGTRWPPLHALVRIRNYEESQYPPPKTAEGDLDSLELARHLLAHGEEPNAKAATKTARKNPGDMNYTEFKGATPFFLAAKAGDIPMMRLLLSVRADPTTPIDEHTTPLMAAAGVGCVPKQWIEPGARWCRHQHIAAVDGKRLRDRRRPGTGAPTLGPRSRQSMRALFRDLGHDTEGQNLPGLHGCPSGH
jgi:ankyrin repeat protein